MIASGRKYVYFSGILYIGGTYSVDAGISKACYQISAGHSNLELPLLARKGIQSEACCLARTDIIIVPEVKDQIVNYTDA